MRLSFNVLIIVLVFVSLSNAQELTREQKLEKISDLRSQIESLEKDFLLPAENDLRLAEKQGFGVFRLLPHENSSGKLALYGDGAYYSFARKTNQYGYGSDIKLDKGNLRVGFAGADYGFIYDLEKTPLAYVTKETVALGFLVNYKPPTIESEVRSEQKKARNYEAEGITYKGEVPAIVGNTYVLRSINFSRSDVLVAFKIMRKDTDGSLIIFWKPLENFETPRIARAQ